MPTYTPVFPTWQRVAVSLFRNSSAKSFNTVDSPLNSFQYLISHIQENFCTPPSEMEQIALAQKYAFKRNHALRVMSEEEAKSQMHDLPLAKNQFYLVCDTLATDFLWRSENTKNLLGLETNEDFTFLKICGMDDRDELYHPEDVAHIIRFGASVLAIAAISGFEISPFTDYYEVSFRMGWNDESRFKTIRRQCSLSNWPDRKEGVRHFDSWCVTDGHERFDHVHWQLHFSDTEASTRLNGMFYILNCVLLGITPQEAILANLITQHGKEYKDVFNREVSKALGIPDFQYENQQTYFNQKSQLKKKVDKLIFNSTKGSKFKSNPTSRAFHFRCGQTGILGMDQKLKECIWKNVSQAR